MGTPQPIQMHHQTLQIHCLCQTYLINVRRVSNGPIHNLRPSHVRPVVHGRCCRPIANVRVGGDTVHCKNYAKGYLLLCLICVNYWPVIAKYAHFITAFTILYTFVNLHSSTIYLDDISLNLDQMIYFVLPTVMNTFILSLISLSKHFFHNSSRP